MFPKGSRRFLPQQPNEIRKKGKMYKTPKAEVTGSNPVGCANHFKWLHHHCDMPRHVVSGICPENPFARGSGPLDVETKNPAAAGTVAGAHSEIIAPFTYRAARSFARYRVDAFLSVEVLT